MESKLLTLFCFYILISSCKEASKNNSHSNSLSFISQVTNLTLRYQNNKCGEWGGDEEKIVLFRKDFEGILYADYTLTIRNCDPYNNKIHY